MKQPINIGDSLPSLSVQTTSAKDILLTDIKKGKNLILYFYPRDNTPGCTLESKTFSEKYSEVTDLNTVILGVSKDSMKSHEKFKDKYKFPFDLIADENGQLCQYFDVIKQKSMYGKIFNGIERSTFLFDQHDMLVKEWRKIKVKGHIEEVLSAIQTL